MPAYPGQAMNPGGRYKRAFPRLDKLLKDRNIDPVAEILRLLPTVDNPTQLKVWLEVLSYCHGKPKAPPEEEQDDLADMPTAELIQLVKENMSKFDVA